jgi:PAS domain S-box-containing protein
MKKTLRILHVEDSELDALLLTHHLQLAGYELFSERVDTPGEMTDALQTKEWDVVLCDYSMPDFSALSALALLKSMNLDLPFIIVSGTVGEDVAVKAMLSGANDYLLKDNLTRLIPTIEREMEEVKNRRARRQVEEALRVSEERYRDLVENAHDIIYSHDLEGNYTSMNKAGKVITGYSLEEVLQLNILKTVAPEYRSKAREMLERKLAGERITAYELEIMAKDGARIIVEVNTKLEYHGGVPVGVQGIARDVTARKQLEDQLRQSQKMDAVGQLAGGIAHDFNNLLTAISGYSELTLRKLDADNPLRRNLEEIKKAGDRAASLTRQLLAFSRKQVLQPRVLNLNSIVSDVESMLGRLIGENIELRTSLSPDLGRVKADPGQIEQVLLNLVVNARDAMAAGGSLVIETANVYLDEEFARQHIAIEPGYFVLLAVSDNGMGIAEEIRSRIFEPFFTTKEVGKGTGLGLSTVYGIVKQSGGTIWVYSEVGIGTTFKVYLPCVDRSAQDYKRPEHWAGELRGTGTVLLAEDEVLVRNLTSEVLRLFGYSVLEAASGREALEICEQLDEPIELLITDVVMPEMSGRELADRLKQLRPEVKVLFMSGYTDDAIVHQGVLEAGANFIQKPFAPEALANKIREVLLSEDPPSSA